MVWCSTCSKHIVRTDLVDGKACCPLCGKVLFEDNFSEEATFVKNSSGQSQLSGNFVLTVQSDQSLSRQRTLDEAQYGIAHIVYALGIDGGDSIIRPAVAFYRIAIERNFTRGRRKDQVEAACLYIACREVKKPYLLIDFSEHLRINVYVLGAVFLQLCILLSLAEHPIVQKTVDPSLFIHKFTDRLFGCRKPSVSKTALQIVASMKRDWMQTGRKPSGLCGAALYISALSHGHHFTKSDVIKVVHICEATLTKRLIEFENTDSGGMTIEEFKIKAEELEIEERKMLSIDKGGKASGISQVLCRHGNEGPPFAHGLCRACYEEFMKLSGGLEGGSEPPAFQRAEMERMSVKEAELESSTSCNSSTLPVLGGDMNNFLNSDTQKSIKKTSENEALQRAESGLTDATLQNETMRDSSNEKMHAADDATFEESENLSDIDDREVNFYLHNEEEKQLKKIIWEELNKEYLEEQAAKEAAELAAEKAGIAKPKKVEERQQRRASDGKNAGPAATAAEATKQVLDKKRLSSKIRYDVLEKLFEEPEKLETTSKKIRTDPQPDEFDNHAYNSSADFEMDDNENGYNESMDDFGYDDNSFLDDY